jgi:hypothetical protein
MQGAVDAGCRCTEHSTGVGGVGVSERCTAARVFGRGGGVWCR